MIARLSHKGEHLFSYVIGCLEEHLQRGLDFEAHCGFCVNREVCLDIYDCLVENEGVII